MNNKIGLGVFGTFGEPLGYQQVFYFDVSFDTTLDLDESEIEFYPGSELYAVKRELVDDVYKITFCIYSSVRAPGSDRIGTFLGSCIVLEDSYAEADYIYKVLKELHDDVLSNSENVENYSLKAQQALDVLVKEPADFVALQANVIPISKTPFNSSLVDPEKKCFVSPNADSTESRDAQLVAFFDEALKHFTDTGTLYFSFDRNVAVFVEDADFLAMNNWEEFTNYKSQGLPPPMVLTKKGIQKFTTPETDAFAQSNESLEIEDAATNFDLDAGNEPEFHFENDSEEDATENDFSENNEINSHTEEDPYKPFDIWEEPIPESGLSPEEAKAKQSEYNRLFNYTSKLLDHMNGKTGDRANDDIPNDPPPEFDMPPEFESRPNRKKKIITIILIVLILAIVSAYFITSFGGDIFSDSKPATTDSTSVVPDENSQGDESYDEVDTTLSDSDADYPEEENYTDTVSAVPEDMGSSMNKIDTATDRQKANAQNISEKENTGEIIPLQPVAKVNPDKQSDNPPAVPTSVVPSRGASPPDSAAFDIMKEAITITPSSLADAKDLHPRPNFEIYQNDILILRKVSITNMTLSEITKLLFKNEPVKIGYIYRGQETEYMAALYYLNHKLFQKTGNDYIFTGNYMQLKIPAYRSPPLPVSFPK